MRRTAAVLMGLIGLVLLSGCFKVNLDVEVSADDTVNGSMVFAVAEDMYSMMEQSDEEMFSTDDLPEGATVADYDSDGFKGKKVTFKDVPLAEFNDSLGEDDPDEGTFKLTHEGDKYLFKGEFDASQELGAEGGDDEMGAAMGQMMEQMLKGAEFKVSITFPGEVLETNGKKDGRTATWDLDITKPSTMEATASETGGGGFNWVALVIAIVVLVLLGVGGFLLLRNRGKADADASVTAPAEGAAADPGASEPTDVADESTPADPADTTGTSGEDPTERPDA